MPEDLRLKIADIVFSILPTDGIKGFYSDKKFSPVGADGEPDVVLETIRNGNPLLNKGGLSGEKTLFNTTIWNYEQADGRHIFNSSLSPKNNRPQRILALEPDYKKGKIILTKIRGLKNGILQSPFS